MFHAAVFVIWMLMNLFSSCIFFREEIYDTDLSPLASLQFVRYEGKCDRGGTTFPLYYFIIPRNAFEQHLEVNSVARHGAQMLRDAWVMSIQSLVYDVCLINDTDKRFIIEMCIDDWMGPRNVIELLRNEDHHVCPVTPPRDCSVVHQIVFPLEIMLTPKWSYDCPENIALTAQDVELAGSVHCV